VPVTGLAHEVDRYLACLQALGLPTEGARPEFFPAPADRTAALAALQAAGWRGGPLAVVHPGGGSNPGMVLEAKRWPPDRYAQIIACLHRAGYEVALVGAAADRASASISRCRLWTSVSD
jgi:heptosyltransferase-2